MAARTLFVEMCVKLAAWRTTNGAIAHHLMSADLKAVHAKLANTIASPLTATEAARMAESIRAVFNTNAQAIRSCLIQCRESGHRSRSGAGCKRSRFRARSCSSPRPIPI
jgi:hypothetical protein